MERQDLQNETELCFCWFGEGQGARSGAKEKSKHRDSCNEENAIKNNKCVCAYFWKKTSLEESYKTESATTQLNQRNFVYI